MRKYSVQNLNIFVFVLKNIFVDNGDVKTPARWFSEEKSVNACRENWTTLFQQRNKTTLTAASRVI